MQNDSYYDQLPYTLPVEQSNPDFVIFGTGLQECIIAAHLTKIQSKKGLILDIDKSYGGCLKTATIKQLHLLTSNIQTQRLYQFVTPQKWKKSNEIVFNKLLESKQHRGYNIDIEPNFFFGSSVTCEMMKEAQMDKYMDFRMVYHMMIFEGNKLNEVPLSKGKIFQSKTLSLLEKKLLLNSFHEIIRIYNKLMKVQEDQNSTHQFDKNFGIVNQELYTQFLDNLQKPFMDIIFKLTKKNVKIMNYLTYIICNYQYNYRGKIPSFIQSDYTIKGFIDKFAKFVKSCGIYGDGPYLYVDNGIGDIPQAFSRIASIYGSVYILHPKISINSIKQNEGKLEISSNLVPEKSILTDTIYYGPTLNHLLNSNNESYQEQNILRVIMICQKMGLQEECPSIAYFLDLQMFINPVYLFMFDEQSHTCPKNFITYQFQTIIEKKKQNYENQINKLIELLTTIRGESFNQKIKYLSVYIRKRLYPSNNTKNQQSVGICAQVPLRDNTGIDLDGHFINMKNVIGQQSQYFKKLDHQKNNEEGIQQYEDDTTQLISKLNELKLTENNSQEKQEKSKEQETKQQEAIQKGKIETVQKVEILQIQKNEETINSEYKIQQKYENTLGVKDE